MLGSAILEIHLTGSMHHTGPPIPTPQSAPVPQLYVDPYVGVVLPHVPRLTLSVRAGVRHVRSAGPEALTWTLSTLCSYVLDLQLPNLLLFRRPKSSEKPAAPLSLRPFAILPDSMTVLAVGS